MVYHIKQWKSIHEEGQVGHLWFLKWSSHMWFLKILKTNKITRFAQLSKIDYPDRNDARVEEGCEEYKVEPVES